MHQNFGPLNKAGGERRLNVAITRARMHVKLVASIGADDIDGSSSVGTRLLKDYISFAASGGRQDIVQAGHDRKNWPNLDPSLEDDVHRALVAEGMRVHRQVGCSGYRIDLAVEDPARPGTFLLGIECDGNAYRSGKTARDRDRIRESVLRGLGWNIHRIWSKEWVEDRSKEIEKVKKALAAADGASRAVGPGISHVPGTGAAPNDFALEKETFLPAFLDLVKERGPVHRDVARDVLDGHVHRPEDVERALSERLYALTKSGAISLKDGFIWSAQMSIPPIRRPEGREPMDLGLVALEEIAEAELYCMGENDDMAREELIERTAAFYRYESIPGQVRVRLELAAEHLVRSGRLVSQGKGRLRRAR
jgi:very-short-patch-repair endonuclease